LKTCSKCGQGKPETEFHFIRRTQLLAARCKTCHSAANKAWREANAERVREANRQWALSNPDRIKAAQQRWKDRNPGIAAERMRAWREANPERHSETLDRIRQKTKDQVFEAYGGKRCACCGETEPLFLSIDHVNNDGAAHRKEIGEAGRGGMKVYRWLIKNGFPPGFQVLCMNCNCGKARNNGVCPHMAKV
jgi:hypothetical protein